MNDRKGVGKSIVELGSMGYVNFLSLSVLDVFDSCLFCLGFFYCQRMEF